MTIQPVNNGDSGLLARTKINDNFAELNTQINGGFSQGQLLIGNASGSATKANLTAGNNISIANGNGSIAVSFSGTLPVANGGTGTATALTAGSVVFAGASGVYSQDNANLFWDDANNRLGIGTSAPDRRLDVQGAGNITVRSRSTDTSGVTVGIVSAEHASGSQLQIRAGVGFTNLISAGAADPLILSTNNTERMRITDTGNVGIGTSSPTTQLDIHGFGNLALRRNSTDSVAQILLSQAGTGDSVMDFLLVGTRAWRMGVDNSDADKFKLQPSQTADFSGAVVAVDVSGNVGIGTSSPASILDVTSTTSGLLPPRMTGAQRDAITAPPNGTILYNTTTDKLQVRAAGSWVDLH